MSSVKKDVETQEDTASPGHEQSMLDVIRSFGEGALPRDDYWRTMQKFHLLLEQYSSLVERADLDRIEITSDELRLVFPSGLKIRWRPEDIRTVPNILLNHGEYEASELDLIGYFAQAGQCKVIFDVGANIGWYSLHLAMLADMQDREIHAFEPVPSTYKELAHNVALNEVGKTVHTHNMALGAAAGKLEFYVPAFTGSVAASSRPLFPDDENRTVECAVTTLDSFVDENRLDRLDMIKCDVEGSELFVLQGGLQTIGTHKPLIMLEMLRKWARAFNYHPNDIIALLLGLNYTCWTLDGSRFERVSLIDDSSKQTNFFFLHSDRHRDLQEQVGAAEFRFDIASAGRSHG